MANEKANPKLSKKAHRPPPDGGETKGIAKSPAVERQLERENQTGRGSGEGTSGFERGDGHPTGR